MSQEKIKYKFKSENGWTAVAITHIGLKRKNNEDRFLFRELDAKTLLVAVADGMGGEVAGEYAAELITKKLTELKYFNGNVIKELSRSVLKADEAILNESTKNPGLEGMGSTVTCAIIKGLTIHWAHVGDSRLYVFRKEKLYRLTKDHNMVQFLIDEGEITKEESYTHPGKYFLDQCVGQGDCEPETDYLKLFKGDMIILSTDGLHGEVDRKGIIDILKRQTSLESKADNLLKAVLNTGGKDNITFILIQL